MRLEFDRFSPQAFECLAQALCSSFLGPGTAIFGSGPDGAREATFEGEVAFPSSVDRWNGYIVVQAKCRERLRKNSEDASWLGTQLTKDLEKFLDRKRKLRKPEFFLLISNIELSSVAVDGGKAKIDAIFESYKQKLGLKGYAVWSADELRSLLSSAEDIRRAYTAWLSPSDVLADLVDSLKRPNLTKFLPLSLSHDIRQERDVRLKDAGQETDKPIYLDEVFIDLPLTRADEGESSERPGIEFASDDENGVQFASETTPMALRRLLNRASEKLDPLSIDSTRSGLAGSAGKGLPNRIVILGGPGQGKSTLGQFVAQIGRARLLDAHKQSRLNPEIRDILPAVLARAECEELDISGPVRYPIRIGLPDFADALERSRLSGNLPSLLSFIASKISKDIRVEIDADDLREWLGRCPSMIVLDGLDEVPPTANRADVISSIDCFWDDLHFVAADTLVLVTTRPQGYNHDLNPKYWEHWELAPLQIRHAKALATLLASVRLSDINRRVEIVAEIEKAGVDDAIQSLMTSPLQVAIMFGIVLLKGTIPRDRWDLFDRYYSLLRDREAQKPGSLVREYKREIDVLHQECGFLLHVAAENAGKSVAYFTPEEFRFVIERLLRKEEYSEDEVARIATDLQNTVTHRLVFLASRITDQIAFDVRSLQEFMAAAQITSASSVNLVARLRAAACNPHWRNVFRIAASKVFSVAELGHYRDDIVSVCHALDNGDFGEEYRLCRAGASLAADLLADGIASTAPKYRKNLLRRAFAILDAGPVKAPSVLVKLSSEYAEIAKEEMLFRLQQRETKAAHASFRLLFDLHASQVNWAEDIILAYWPPFDSIWSFEKLDLRGSSPNVRSRIVETMWAVGPSKLEDMLSALRGGAGVSSQAFAGVRGFNDAQFPAMPKGLLRSLDGLEGRGTDRIDVSLVHLKSSRQGGLMISVPSLEARSEFVIEGDLTKLPPSWGHIADLSEFASKGSVSSLAILVRKSARKSLPEHLLWHLPWIVRAVFQLLDEGFSSEELADDLAAGLMGDVADWMAAEERWKEFGVTIEDMAVIDRRFPIGEDVAQRGPPPFIGISVAMSGIDVQGVQQLISVALGISNEHRQRQLLKILFFAANSEGVPKLIETNEMFSCTLRSLQSASSASRSSLLRSILDSPANIWLHQGLLEFVDHYSRNSGLAALEKLRSLESGLLIIDCFKSDISKRGLLPFVLFAVIDHEPDIGSLPDVAFRVEEGDTPSIRSAVILLKVLSGRWDYSDFSDILDQLRQDCCCPIVQDVLQEAPLKGDQRRLLSEVVLHLGSLPDREAMHQDMLEVLQRRMDGLASRLSDPQGRAELALPLLPSEEK